MSKAAELAALIGSQTAQSNRNLVINGAMNVAQRGTSVTGIGGDADYKTIDRFRLNTSNTAGRLTMSQSSVTDLPGFANALKLDCTTADTSIASTEVGIIQYRFEGQDLQQLKKGTSSAEPVTVSFYVKGNASATYTCEFEDSDNSYRANSQEFSVTTSWNRVSLTYVGDTTGTLDDDNAQSMQLNFWFHAGSNFTSGTFASNTWQTDQTKRVGDNQTSFFDSTDRTLEITGLQMEIGEVATPFEHEDIGTTLAKCQRYFQVHSGLNIRGYASAGLTRVENMVSLPVEMRAAPTSAIITSGNNTNVRSSHTTYSGFRLGTTTGNAILSVESAAEGIVHISGRTETLTAEL
jgi:hypothetical protein